MADNNTFIFYYGELYYGIKISSYIIAVIIFIGNGLSITAIIRLKWLQTRTNTFIFSLCMADLYTGVMNTMWYVTDDATVYTESSTINYFMVAAYATTVLALVDIAVERFISIKYPFRYENLVSKRKVILVIVITWFVPNGLFLIVVITNLIIPQDPNVEYTLWEQFIIVCQFGYIILGVILVVLYINILKIAYKQAQEIKKNLVETATKTRFKSEMKATVTLGVVVLAYVVSYNICLWPTT